MSLGAKGRNCDMNVTMSNLQSWKWESSTMRNSERQQYGVKNLDRPVFKESGHNKIPKSQSTTITTKMRTKEEPSIKVHITL